MRFKKEKLLEQAKAAATKKKLLFASDIIAHLPCGRNTYYDYELHKDEELTEILNKNRTDVKVSLRKKWLDSDNATLQMGLMKLVSSNDERKKLSTSYHDITSDGESINTPQRIEVEFRDFSDEEE